MKALRDKKRRPTHPGAILREDVLPALEMTQTEFAQRLGVLSNALLRPELAAEGLDISRSRDTGRDIEL